MQQYKKIYPSFSEGAYACVFFSDGFAIKVFKNRTDAPREHVDQVFSSEVRAYEVATSDELLKTYVPQFFGKTCCGSIQDASGLDISNEFHLDLSYTMKFVDGVFEKIGLNDPQLVQQFRLAGIRHTKDCSVVKENGAVKCIVDFAMEEYELWHQEPR